MVCRLTNAIDYRGDICGIEDDVKNTPAAYYLATGAVVCVKKCPKATDYSKFICYYNLQAEVDADTTNTVGWGYVEDGKCIYEVATQDGTHTEANCDQHWLLTIESTDLECACWPTFQC